MYLRSIAAASAVIALTLGLSAPSWAEPMGGTAAKKQLFAPEGARVVVFNLPMLSDKDKLVIGELGKQQKYYAAIAISPDEGLMSEPTLAAANHHSIPAAEAAARAACDKRRKRGSARCVIVAQITPSGYKPRDLQLSADATAGVRRSYGTGNSGGAVAISPATGEWSMARGQGAGTVALGDCNRTATARGAKDCKLVILD